MSNDKAAAPPFRFKFLPVLTVVLLALGLPWLAGEVVDYARHYSHRVPPMADAVGWSYATHGVLLVFALIAIAAMKWLAPADYGLHRPRGKSYLVWALVWGAGFGAAMGALHYWLPIRFVPPETLGAHPPPFAFMGSLATGEALRALANQGLFVGPVEEILFRALLVSFLAAAMPGRWRIAGVDMNVAGVVVALVYALCAMTVFPVVWVSAAHTLCLLALGILYAYWLEKSKSVVAPIVGHSLAGMTALAVVLALGFA